MKKKRTKKQQLIRLIMDHLKKVGRISDEAFARNGFELTMIRIGLNGQTVDMLKPLEAVLQCAVLKRKFVPPDTRMSESDFEKGSEFLIHYLEPEA